MFRLSLEVYLTHWQQQLRELAEEEVVVAHCQ
jgi:hypothetical protein